MSNQDPAFLFYSKDWLTGTADMMPDEKGVYIDLLAFQHQRNGSGLPDDVERLARMVGLPIEKFTPLWDKIKDKFIHKDNRMVNLKLQQIIDERATNAKKKRIAAAFATLMRKEKLDAKATTQIKKDFKIDDFIEISEDTLVNDITEWFSMWLSMWND